MSYKIGVIGTGYVGLVSGTCFASTGNDVWCVDIDKSKIDMLQKGIPPIYEPGIERLLERNLKDGRLHFTTDLEDAVKNCLIIFLCLPTPPNEDGSADLHHVLKTAEQIAEILIKNDIHDKRIVVNKSTVPFGTAQKVRDIFDRYLGKEHKVEIASNPEFLREGFALEDSLKPDRIVVGTRSKWVEEIMRDLYQPFVRSGNPIYVMDEKSAEVTKYAANSFLAIKISFMNDLSAFCEEVGADIENIRMGIGSDTRIGKRFLFAGAGYGGSCFPKDVRALLYSSEQVGTPLQLINAAQEVNYKQMERFTNKILKRFGNNVKGRKITLWGLAFKNNTDDTRESPAFRIIEVLLEHGALVQVFDPEAMDNTRLRFGDKISYHSDMYQALEGSEALVIATEWNDFKTPDMNKVKEKLKIPIIIDGRNLYNPQDMEELEFEYHCIGRVPVNANKYTV